MSWQPILDGVARDEAMAAVKDIFDAVPAFSDDEGPALAGGAAGKALFLAYAARAGVGTYDPAEEQLGKAVDAVADQPMRPDLYSGFTGIAFVAEHLQGSPPGEGEDANEAIDEALVEFVSHTPWQTDYDLIIGLVGFGAYALERGARPVARRLLAEVVARLDEIKQPMTHGVSWLTAPLLMIPETAKDNPEGYYNAGLAHGVPGVIAVLGAACAAGVAVERARPLLDGAVAWMLSLRARVADGSEFPYAIAKHDLDAPHVGSRAAWCYGDPGVAVALLGAARALGHPEWERIALEVGKNVAARDPAHCGTVDAGLCHGTAGLAHIYNRLYQASGDPCFRDAARLWLERTFALRKPGAGVGGWLAYSPLRGTTKLEWQPEAGLLTGSAGIGLALLAAATEDEPRWDRMLLTDVPPR